MMKLLIILLLPVAAFGQFIAQASQQRMQIGVFVNEGTYTNTQKADIAYDTLQTDYVRSRAIVANWNGSYDLLDAYYAKGVKQFLTLTAKPTGTIQAFITDSEREGYKDTLQLIASIYNRSKLIKKVSAGNEENNTNYHSGPIKDYCENELKSLYEVFHPLGITVTNGGIIDGVALKIKVYRYITAKYGSDEANLYAASTSMSIPQVNAAITVDSDTLLEAAARQIDTLKMYATYLDEINFHVYKKANDDNDTLANTLQLRYNIEFLKDFFGKQVTTNETGQWDSQAPGIVRNHLEALFRLGISDAIWYSGDDTRALSLTNLDGTLRDNGRAFIEWSKTH